MNRDDDVKKIVSPRSPGKQTAAMVAAPHHLSPWSLMMIIMMPSSLLSWNHLAQVEVYEIRIAGNIDQRQDHVIEQNPEERK